MAVSLSKTIGTRVTDLTTVSGVVVSPSEQYSTPTLVTTPLFVLIPGQENASVFVNYKSGTGIKI